MKVIRWFLFLPAALVAWVVANALGDLWVEYVYGPYIPWQPVTDFEKALFPTALAFGSFVLVATFLAPSHQKVVSFVSAGIGAGLLVAIVLCSVPPFLAALFPLETASASDDFDEIDRVSRVASGARFAAMPLTSLNFA